MKGRMKRRGELIVIPGPPLPIVDEDPGKRLTRASLSYAFSNGGRAVTMWIVKVIYMARRALPGALPKGELLSQLHPVHSSKAPGGSGATSHQCHVSGERAGMDRRTIFVVPGASRPGSPTGAYSRGQAGQRLGGQKIGASERGMILTAGYIHPEGNCQHPAADGKHGGKACAHA